MSIETVNIGGSRQSTMDSLIKGMKARDLATLNQLYDLYAPALFGYILRAAANEKVALEVLQNTFLKIWSSMDSYDDKKGRLLTWMLCIARTEGMNYTPQSKLKII